jgi:uncharacterized protein (DUF2237 family)
LQNKVSEIMKDIVLRSVASRWRVARNAGMAPGIVFKTVPWQMII